MRFFYEYRSAAIPAEAPRIEVETTVDEFGDTVETFEREVVQVIWQPAYCIVDSKVGIARPVAFAMDPAVADALCKAMNAADQLAK